MFSYSRRTLLHGNVRPEAKHRQAQDTPYNVPFGAAQDHGKLHSPAVYRVVWLTGSNSSEDGTSTSSGKCPKHGGSSKLLVHNRQNTGCQLPHCWYTTTKIQSANLQTDGTQPSKYRAKLLEHNRYNTGCQTPHCWYTTTKIQGAKLQTVATHPTKYRVPTSKLLEHNRQNTGCQLPHCWYTTTKTQGANLQTVGTQPPKYRVPISTVGTQPPKYRVPSSKLLVHNHHNTGCQTPNCWYTTTKI
jgi:hypothetical protein